MSIGSNNSFNFPTPRQLRFKDSFDFPFEDPMYYSTKAMPPNRFVENTDPFNLMSGVKIAPDVSRTIGTSGNIAPATKAIASKGISQLIGKYGLGKAGLAGVPYLGTALAIGGALGLGKLFGRRSGPSQQQIAMNNLSNEMFDQSRVMSGYLGSMGRDLTDSGRQAMLLGRSRALDALTNPSVRMAQEANLASQLGNARAGISPYVGILGGTGAGARYARSLNQFDPSLAQGMVGIGQNAIANRAQAGNMLAGFGGQDFGQGLGMQQTGFQIGQGGMGQRMGYLQGQQQLAAQQKAQRQAGLTGAAQLVGGLIANNPFKKSPNTTGLFG